MNHHVVVEIEKKSIVPDIRRNGDIILSINLPDIEVIQQCWNILYKVPLEREDLGEESLSFKGCLAWIENNKVEGSKYAVVKMYLV